MSIETRPYYIAQCDECEELLCVSSEFSFSVFESEQEAASAAKDCGWKIEGDKALCFECKH